MWRGLRLMKELERMKSVKIDERINANERVRGYGEG